MRRAVSSSARTTIVMREIPGRSVLPTLTANHVVEVSVGGDHWIDAVLLLDAKVDHRCTGRLARASHHVLHFLAARGAKAGQPMRFRELDKIRILKRSGDVAPAVEKFLPLPNHPQVAIVDDRDVEL